MSNKTCPTEVCPPVPTTTTPVVVPAPTKQPPPNPSPNATARNAVWLGEDGSHALVKLLLPGLSLIDPFQFGSTTGAIPPSVLLNFTITSNGKHLILNGDLLALQVPDPSIPSLLQAMRVPSDWPLDPGAGLIKPGSAHLATELDYYLSALNRDDPNIRYYNYHPEIYLGIIGAGTPGTQVKTLVLDSPDQKWLKIFLHDRNKGGASDDPNRHYAIERISFEHRPADWEKLAPHPDDRTCSLWSWRCADLGDPPWYQYVWRQNFDEYGRIGCLRRALLKGKVALIESLSSIPWPIQLICAAALFFRLSGTLRRWRGSRAGNALFQKKKEDLVK